MKPVVSIAVPTYNRGHLLNKFLSVLCLQIDKDGLHEQVEIVVSDNCSIDNTEAIVNEFLEKKRYLIVYNRNEQNLGVIKNILKLVELSNGKYWMFYGDDDIIPDGALKRLVEDFNHNSNFSAFMYRWPEEADDYCKNLNGDTELSYTQLASDYFYYIGNAGIFAVETEKAKVVVKAHYNELIDTCWPQTLIVFIAMELSQNKKIKFTDIVSSVPPTDIVVVSNSYYLFETTIYALLRTALYIEKIIMQPFVDKASSSIYGIQYFESLKATILERYYFFDLPKQKKDLENSVKEARRKIPVRYRTEIDYVYNYTSRPKLFLYLKFYMDYLRVTEFKKLRTGFLNKLKIMSPLGFNAITRQRIEIANNEREKNRKTEVDSSSGYF